MKLTIEDKWEGDGTAYHWEYTEDKEHHKGVSGSLLEAMVAAGHAIQSYRGWPGLVKVGLMPATAYDAYTPEKFHALEVELQEFERVSTSTPGKTQDDDRE